MKILVAEDDLVSRAVLVGMLRKWGYEVLSVSDGDHAIEELSKPNCPKLVILDWLMPGKDGAQVCAEIRKRALSEPPYIILLTVMGQKSDTVLGLQAGANDYITKPYNPGELQARLGVGRRVVELQSALANRVAELEAAMVEIKSLQGILPICMHCHKIRTDEKIWQQLEAYISEHSKAKFSHGICPDCMKRLYPNYVTACGSRKRDL